VDLFAITSTEGTIGGDGGMTGTGARWWRATIGCEVRRIAHPLSESLEHRDFERCPSPRSFTPVERRENPREGVHASRGIRDRDADFRGGFGRAGHRDESRFTLHQQIICLLVTVRPRSTVAGDATYNQTR